MAKLMKASEWSAREFTPGSRPHNKTVKAWIEKGKISGRIIDQQAYVFEDQCFGVPMATSQAVNSLIAASGL